MKTLTLAALAALAVAGSAGASPRDCKAVALRAAPALDDRGVHTSGLQIGEKTKLTQLLQYRGGDAFLCQAGKANGQWLDVCYPASDLRLLNCHVDRKIAEETRWADIYDLKP